MVRRNQLNKDALCRCVFAESGRRATGAPSYDALGKLGKTLKSGIDIRNCLLGATKCLRSFFLSPHERLDKGIPGSEHIPVLAEPQVKLGYQILQMHAVRPIL